MATARSVVFSKGIDFDNKESSSSAIPTNLPVHLRLQQRNGRKSITIIEGLARDLNLKKIAKALKQTFSTSCAIKSKDEKKGAKKASNDADDEKILQLAGDRRREVANFLEVTHICEKKQIKIHGF
jgi:translation initiation factor 1